MKLTYYKDTDSLYIDLSGNVSTESREVSDGIVLDYDAQGNIVGIDIDNATAKVALDKLIVSSMPGSIETEAAWPGPPGSSDERLMRDTHFTPGTGNGGSGLGGRLDVSSGEVGVLREPRGGSSRRLSVASRARSGIDLGHPL